MNILMTGGTGFLGSALRRRLAARGDTITCLTRSASKPEGATTFVKYEDLDELGAFDAVVNLAGESVVGLWTAAKRKAIYDSRIDTTRKIAEWIDRSSVKPMAFLSGSATGIYGDAGDKELTETTDVSRSEGFLAKVTRDWEQAASSAAWRGTRTVLLRTGHVLDPAGGYLGKALPLFRKFPIVVLGRRDSFIPWIALYDWVELVLFALDQDSIAGPLNLVGPTPSTQGEFIGAIAAKLGKRVWGAVPPWALRLGAGEFGASIVSSQKVLPQVAQRQGFGFEYGSVDDYLDRSL